MTPKEPQMHEEQERAELARWRFSVDAEGDGGLAWHPEGEWVKFDDLPKPVSLEQASAEYFGKRPQIDTMDRRNVFKAGFERASLAKPQPVALTDEAILHRWDTHVGEPDAKRPLTDGDKIDFARACIALATLSAPVAQPANQCDGCARGLPTRSGPVSGMPIHYGPTDGDLIACTADRYATPIAAQPAAADPVAHLNVTMEWPEREQGRHAGDEPYKSVRASTVDDAAMKLPVGRYPLYLAAPAQAAAVPEAVDLTAQRKKFMNWACDEFNTVHVKGDSFKERDVRAAWLGWKAALAAPEAGAGGQGDVSGEGGGS
jgi:hypothetical protein